MRKDLKKLSTPKITILSQKIDIKNPLGIHLCQYYTFKKLIKNETDQTIFNSNPHRSDDGIV